MQCIDPDRIDLAPDPLLLDSKFENYKLSLEHFPVKSVEISPPALILYASEEQWSLPHVKIFSEHNNLVIDWLSSTADGYLLYLVGQDQTIIAVQFCHDTKKWSTPRPVCLLSPPPDAISRKDRLPASIFFPDSNAAIVSNGFGKLAMYETGNRHEFKAWTQIFEVEPLTEQDLNHPFVILDCRMLAVGWEILLLSVLEHGDRHVRGKGSAFANRLHWISVQKSGTSPTITRIRRFDQPGHLEFATFDCVCECLIVAGTMKTRIESDSAKPIEKHHDSSATGTSMEVDAAKENEKPASTAYVWSQTPDDVTAIFLVDETVKKTDVGFSISAQSIHLNVKDTVLLGGQLGGVVSVDECTWVIENGRIELTLFKEAGRLVWTDLVMGDNRGQYQADPGLLADVAERLAKFTSDKPALGTDGIVQNFNSGELEECDMAEDDSCTMQWIHGETHRVVAEADISGRQILFTARLAPDSPLCFCVRHDVDGILWEFSGDKRRPVVHRATFHALGYVQASKQQRRFTTCPPNGAYSTIIESQKHAFVYWQPAAIDGDLRNRKNGRRVASVAKQQLINLVEEGDRNKGSIVGAIATDNTLFLLTERNLYAIVVVENTSGRVPE